MTNDSRFHETDQNISMDTDLLGDSGEKRLPIVFWPQQS